MATAWKNSCFILLERSDFHMVVSQSIIVHHALPMHMLTLLSIDGILLLRNVKWSTNFRGLPFYEEIVPSLLKYLNSVLFDFLPTTDIRGQTYKHYQNQQIIIVQPQILAEKNFNIVNFSCLSFRLDISTVFTAQDFSLEIYS